MFMTGGSQSKVKVVLRNPIEKHIQLDYTIRPNNTLLARDWIDALKDLLKSGKKLEKNYCFMGFPHTNRNLDHLCNQLNRHIKTINEFNQKKIWKDPYIIEEWFSPDVVRFGEEYDIGYDDTSLGLSPKHDILNRLHNHFERLQGVVWNLSEYYKQADYETKYAIRQLNNLCHEMETLILSQRKIATLPYWVRPSQITTWLQAPRLDLKSEHREGFLTNGYDRVLGGVYMHWTQIGKTYFEVFRDESAPELTDTVCEAITDLKYYSGEFDVEWGNDVVQGGEHSWHNEEIENFTQWLIKNNRDPNDPNLSLGYLPLGQVELMESFGTKNAEAIWQMIGSHLDIYKVEVDGVSATYDYCWSDDDYEKKQIEEMQEGYDYSSRR
jgi:hypothetical protein